MGFGDSVAALLETYSNCLSLLKAFKRKGGNQLIEAEDHRAHLRKSLKSDRALVERAYSTRLSRSGSRLSKGDAEAPAVSALGRILKKLRAAIANLLRFSSTKQGLDLDYQSLMSLSNSSRVDAIKAIDRLSRRLDSPSRSSVVTSSSKTSSSPSASSRHKRHSSSSPDEAPRRSKTASPESAPKKTSSSSKDGKAVGKPKPESRARNPPAEKSRPAAKTSHRRTGSGEKRAPPPPAPPETAPPLPNRISFISISTDSTKLGEIPERKLRRRYPTADSSSDEYNVAPMYPLKPYTTEVKERRFWGMFGRNRDGRTAPSGH